MAIARERQVPYKETDLENMKLKALVKLLGEISPTEFAFVEQLRALCANTDAETINDFFMKYRIRKPEDPQYLVYRFSKLSKLPELKQIPVFNADIRLDSSQQLVCDSRHRNRIILNAGPGSGKTTTLTHITKLLTGDNPEARILVLVFNRTAEAEFKHKLSCWGCKVNDSSCVGGKTKASCVTKFGIWVMTFNKFACKVIGKTSNNYTKDIDLAVAKLLTLSSSDPLVSWDHVILDEAQDMTSKHAAIGEAVSRTAKVIIAGDPRQELYDGCTWFPMLYRDNPKDRMFLEYNHRSSKSVVGFLNAFSSQVFPELHVDQKASSEEDGEVQVHVVRRDDDFSGYIGDLVSQQEPKKSLAIGVVTIRKFGLEEVRDTTRQKLYESQFGSKVTFFGDIDLRGDDYIIATSNSVKGSERDVVVTYGFSRDYDRYRIDRASLMKKTYVALSRAKKSLHIVLNSQPICSYYNKIRDLLSRYTMAGNEIKCSTSSKSDRLRTSLPVSSDDLYQDTLCSQSKLDTEFIGEVGVPCLQIDIQNDPDFVGIFVETLVSCGLGMEITGMDVSKNNRSSSLSNDICLINGVQTIFVGGLDTRGQMFRYLTLTEILKRINVGSGNMAYKATQFQYCAKISQLWTVSNRLERVVTIPGLKPLITEIREYLDSEFGKGMYGFQFQQKTCYVIGCHRSPLRSGFDITFVPDIIVTVGGVVAIVIELKHAKSSEQHMRQVGVYASLLGKLHGVTPDAAIVNTLEGYWREVKYPPANVVSDLARAILIADNVKALTEDQQHLKSLPQVFDGKHYLIFVDTECQYKHTTEIGAICVDKGTMTVVDVFQQVCDGVEPFECEPLDDEDRVKKWTNIEDLTGLKVRDRRGLEQGQSKLIGDFHAWMDQYARIGVFVHWGGNESSLVGKENATCEMSHHVYRPWLEFINPLGDSMKAGLKLKDALERIAGQSIRIAFHRAFEDALATMVVFMGCYQPPDKIC